MNLKEWLWRRKWPTLTESQISSIIADIAPRYGVKYVAFKSSGTDGIVRPNDTLDVYVVNNGGLSYAGLVFLSGEIRYAMNRDADFYPMEHMTERHDLDKLNATIAYAE